MALRNCDYESCPHGAERETGSCVICSSHLCVQHRQAPYHACPSEVCCRTERKLVKGCLNHQQDTEPDAYYAAYGAANKKHLLRRLHQINTNALVSLATRLRNGISCTIPALVPNDEGHLDLKIASSQTGGQNCNVDVHFEDGVVWLARIRLDDPRLPPKLTQAYIFLSEVFTLKHLESINVPAPKVFHFEPESPENPVGVPFILMEKMKGTALAWDATPSVQKTKILEQLADIFLTLEKHPLNSTGSIYPSNEPNKISGFAQHPLFETPDTPLGPFNNLETSLRAIFALQMRLIAGGEISNLAVDNYLSHCWRVDMIPKVLSLHNSAGFFLKHCEDKGDHIFVDPDFNITGIIDWEFASVESKALAFSSPCMLWPVGDFYDGSNRLNPEELEFADMFESRGRADMASFIRNGRKMQRYLFFLGGTSREREEFEAMFQGLRAAWAEDGSQVEPYQAWKEGALRKYAADTQLMHL